MAYSRQTWTSRWGRSLLGALWGSAISRNTMAGRLDHMEDGIETVEATSLPVVRMESFGLSESNTGTQNSDAIEACFDSVLGTADPATNTRRPNAQISVGKGNFKIARTISLRSVMGLTIHFAGPQTTNFLADTSMDQIMDLNGVCSLHFRGGFTLKTKDSGTDPSVVVQQAFRLWWDSAVGATKANRSTTNNVFDYIDVTECNFITGIQLGKDANTVQTDSTLIHYASTIGLWYATKKIVSSDYTTNVMTCGSPHGFVDGDKVSFIDLPSSGVGLSNGTLYYIIGATPTTFKVSTSLGGSEVDFFGNFTNRTIASANLWQSGVKVGSGSDGNNMMHTFGHLASRHVRWGVHMAVSSAQINQCDLEKNESAFYIAGHTSYLKVSGGRSEHSSRLLLSSGNTVVPATISIEDFNFHAMPVDTAVDGLIMKMAQPGIVRFSNLYIRGYPDAGVYPKLYWRTNSINSACTLIVDGMAGPTATDTWFDIDPAQIVVSARGLIQTGASLAFVAGRQGHWTTGAQTWGAHNAAPDVSLDRAVAKTLTLSGTGAAGAALQLVAMAATDAPNGSIFLDTADSILKYKDGAAATHALY